MSVDTFIPEYWAGKLLVPLRNAHRFTQPGVINRDYEGDIASAGDTVRIQSLGAVTVGTYTKNNDMSAPETLADAETTLTIDQSKYFNFQVDDVDQRQAKLSPLAGGINDAGYRLANTADAYIAAMYASAGSSVGTSGAPKTDLGTAGKAYDYLVDLGIVLDEANVPEQGRWAIIPPWFHGAILKDDNFVASGSLPADQRLLNGQVGEAAGFALLKSNNVSNDATTWRVMAGNSTAITFASQIAKVEAYRPELRFGDGVKGLHLYGATVVRPAALVTGYFNKP